MSRADAGLAGLKGLWDGACSSGASLRAPHPWPGQGDTNRILIGEAFFRHRPWDDPRNVRDPLDGINHKPDGFGCAGSESTQFLMGDGSVRRMFHKIDPEVLKQLSRP